MSRVECLPDELWLDVFGYLPSRELHRAFTNLNRRFDALVRSTPCRLRIQHPCLEVDRGGIPADRIDALAIENYNAKLGISSLVNLTSLRLTCATNDQLEQIRTNHFEYLRSLTIVTCPMNHRLEAILFGPSPLRYLERCRLPTLILLDPSPLKFLEQCRISSSVLSDPSSLQPGERSPSPSSIVSQVHRPCLTLCSLRLNFCTLSTCSRLLTLLPNLRRLETAIVPSSTSVQHTNEHVNLKYLKVFLRNNVKLVDLQPILSRLSSLETLHLSSYQPAVSEERFNRRELINLLACQLDRLKKCDVELRLSSGTLKRTLRDLKIVK